MSTKIVSYNINGIRAAMKKGLADWIGSEKFDVVCFQETKAHPDQVEMSSFEKLGYQHFWHSASSKKGYSGVATLCQKTPDLVIEGCGIEKYDREGRILRTDFGDITILNCYFPSGTTGDVRQQFKMAFLDDFFHWIQELRKERPKLIIVGDYNIAHTEMDIHAPKRNQKTSGFLPEERAWMTKWFAHHFSDAYRHIHPHEVSYSWWTYRANARANNKGWRIDYQSVTTNLTQHLSKALQLTDIVHSDHCPVLTELDLNL